MKRIETGERERDGWVGREGKRKRGRRKNNQERSTKEEKRSGE